LFGDFEGIIQLEELIRTDYEGQILKTQSEIIAGLKQVLAGRTNKTIVDNNRRPSAVLIPLYYQDEQFHILFTKRTELVHHHKGEISFPGGGFHISDGSLLQTALRESQEEIGLNPDDVEVLGGLDEIITRGSPFIITPFVGVFAAGYHFKTSTFEIAEIITVPVSDLLRPEFLEESQETFPDGQVFAAYVYKYGRYGIIGATARILKQFLDVYRQTIQAGRPG
jgi:8-oxo-dGTP pyrophosphatase MutT (NUDIX family)